MIHRAPKGQVLLQVLIAVGMGVFLLGGIVNWASLNIRHTRQTSVREQAFQIAEAGIEYYRWHLAHAPMDFQDGTGQPGPYVHEYRNKDNARIGEFVLNITPPPPGSTIVTVQATGKVDSDTAVHRTITTKLAVASLAKYAVVADDTMRFGEGTEVFGPVHSNGGIRFDGLAHNLVSSAQTSYDDPDHGGGNEFGVHTHVNPTDPLPPVPIPDRPDVFEAGREIGVPAVDFDGLTADLAQMKIDAQADGFYRPSAGAQGYHIALRTNDTFDLYRVSSFTNAPNGCTNTQDQDGWRTWSIRNQHLIGNFPFPANGLIFLEDDVFVDGQIDTARLTIAAAFFPDNPPFRKKYYCEQRSSIHKL